MKKRRRSLPCKFLPISSSLTISSRHGMKKCRRSPPCKFLPISSRHDMKKCRQSPPLGTSRHEEVQAISSRLHLLLVVSSRYVCSLLFLYPIHLWPPFIDSHSSTASSNPYF
ncbi:hypothetical protein Cni_G13599 [Canna indica]|uniref:Uncharacterized protein n=1 Tax=Canna indica TaxID=4628 RepID=A0AAQ3KEG5_9LILI|nr:hypothetical protein Cni_G13599 [Canna indica]